MQKCIALIRREQITNAALAIVVEQGIEAATMRRLACEVGVSPACLYYYYKDKVELLKAVFEENYKLFMNITRKAVNSSKTTLDTLKYIYNETVKAEKVFRVLRLIIFSDALCRSEPRLKKIINEYQLSIQEVLMNLILQGQSRDEVRSDIQAKELFVFYVVGIVASSFFDVGRLESPEMTSNSQVGWKLFYSAIQLPQYYK